MQASSLPRLTFFQGMVLTEFLCEDCVGKNLGIASAGAARLKELMRVLQATSELAHSGTLPFPSAGMEAQYVFRYLWHRSQFIGTVNSQTASVYNWVFSPDLDLYYFVIIW